MILVLVAVCLLCLAIKLEAFKTILEWLKNILIMTLLRLRSINSSIPEHMEEFESHPSKIEEKSKAGNFKTFLFYTILTALTTRYLLTRVKGNLVGEGPLTDRIIEIIEFKPAFEQFLNFHG